MAGGGRIRQLDRQTAEQIAAGEVVERPAAVVKELVENSLDAGASRIDIQVEQAGRRLIRVTDNGGGIAAADVPLAFERHATSKIRSADDLTRITTLGFRGEALPSIAAVAEVELVTRPAAALAGTRMRLAGGELLERGETGAPPGTRVEVRRLFYNTPARREHLSSPSRELAVIGRLVTGLALGHPAVGFSLSHGDRQLLRTSGAGERRRTVGELLGWEVLERLVPLAEGRDEEAPGEQAGVDGFVGRLQLVRADRDQQFFILNGRPVRSRKLQEALERPFRGRLMRGRFPVAVIWLELTPERFDINIHPGKLEVRFRQPEAVSAVLERAVHQGLAGVQLVPEAGPSRPRRARSRGTGGAGESEAQAAGGDQAPLPAAVDETAAQARVREPRAAWSSRPSGRQPGTCAAGGRGAAGSETRQLDLSSEQQESGAYPQLEPLAQLYGTYIAARSGEALYLVDQHAAHERLYYEALRPSAGPVPQQQLVTPMPLTLAPAEWSLYEAAPAILERLGFAVRPFGGRSVRVEAVPVLFNGPAAPELLRTWLGALRLRELEPAELAEEEAAVTMAACKAAVKAHDRLTHEEMAALLARLCRAEAPYTCPHGRPTTVVLTAGTLERLFGRS